MVLVLAWPGVVKRSGVVDRGLIPQALRIRAGILRLVAKRCRANGIDRPGVRQCVCGGGHVRRGVQEGSTSSSSQVGRPKTSEQLNEQMTDSAQHVGMKVGKLQALACKGDYQLSVELPTSRQAKSATLWTASPALVALMAQRDLAQRQLEEAVEPEALRRDAREADLFAKAKKEAQPRDAKGLAQQTVMEVKLKVVSLEQALIRSMDACGTAAADKVELIEEHANDLEGYQCVADKVSILKEHFDRLSEKATAETALVEGFLSEKITLIDERQVVCVVSQDAPCSDVDFWSGLWVDRSSPIFPAPLGSVTHASDGMHMWAASGMQLARVDTRVACENLEGQRKDNPMQSLLTGFRNAYRSALKEIENPGNSREPKKSPSKPNPATDSDLCLSSAIVAMAWLGKLIDEADKQDGAVQTLVESVDAAFDATKDDTPTLGLPSLVQKTKDACDKLSDTVSWKRILKDCNRPGAHGEGDTRYKLQVVRPPVVASKFVEHLADTIRKPELNDDLFAKRTSGLDKKASDQAFTLQAWAAVSGWTYSGCAPHGLGKVRVVLAGKLSFAFIGPSALKGKGVPDKLEIVSKMREEQLATLSSTKGFFGTASVNDVIVVPAGHLMFYMNNKIVASGLRWSFWGGTSASAPAAIEVIDDMLTTYPKLHEASYSAIRDWLAS